MTVGTKQGRRSGLQVMALNLGAGRRAELLRGSLEQVAITGTEQTIVADLDEAIGQDMLEEAADSSREIVGSMNISSSFDAYLTG